MGDHHGALRHNAHIFESADGYVSRSAAFLKEGLAAGEGAVVLDTRPGLDAVRETLGPDAQEVRFVDISQALTRPAKALAFFHGVYAEELRRTSALRGVSRARSGPDPREWSQWAGFEAAVNHSFSHLPAWLVCSYDANACPDPILENVWRTHPEVFTEGAWSASERFSDPIDVLRQVTPEPKALDGLRSIPFGDPEHFRESLARELRAEGVPQTKVLEMLLAATEVAANAVEYGGGVDDVRIGRVDGRFVCEITDRGGGFDDPAAGYLAPHAGRGKGLWVARQLTWQIEFFRAPAGFTARVWL